MKGESASKKYLDCWKAELCLPPKLSFTARFLNRNRKKVWWS